MNKNYFLKDKKHARICQIPIRIFLYKLLNNSFLKTVSKQLELF